MRSQGAQRAHGNQIIGVHQAIDLRQISPLMRVGEQTLDGGLLLAWVDSDLSKMLLIMDDLRYRPHHGRLRVECSHCPNCGGNLRTQLRRRLRNPKIAKQNSPGSQAEVQAIIAYDKVHGSTLSTQVAADYRTARQIRTRSATAPDSLITNRMLTIDPHPLLDLRAFVTRFSRPLGEMPSPPELQALLDVQAPAPFHNDDSIRETVRQLLRHGGFKPTGRSKPASEYLIRAVGEGKLASINVAVDVCNVVSLHSGLPISVVDLDRARAPFRVGVAPAGAAYVFNASGQTIDLAGLLCLFDADGPCANAVKDAQRTKTTGETTRTLSVVWGSVALPGRAQQTETWYRALLEQQGAITMAEEIDII